MVVKRLEDKFNLDFRAPGFPDELVDNEKEENGYEIWGDTKYKVYKLNY